MLDKLRRFLELAGPGIITGAADDDPSGIATYSQAGAQFGYGQLWSMLVMLPMMIAIQEVCARIGITKGKGIAGVVKDHYPRSILYIAVGLVLIANTINLGADLGAMAAAVRLLLPIPFLVLVVLFACVSLALQVFLSYETYSKYLKLLSVSLFAYVVTAFVVPQDWGQVLKATFVPHIEYRVEFLMILVGLLGTTISPYLFFWQPSLVVEEAKQEGLVPRRQRVPKWGPLPTITDADVKQVRTDTWAGMIFSQLAAWFILVTASGSLHAAGITNIRTAADAARALEPLVRSFPHAGQIAAGIFAAGIVGLGLLAIPVFAGSAAYALAETFGWEYGLAKKPANARGFYAVMAAATVAGTILEFAKIDPMRALIYTAVINGVVAVPLILIILLIGRNESIMGRYRSGTWSNAVGWITFGAMALAAVAMFVSIFR